jgi:hypothetical protein
MAIDFNADQNRMGLALLAAAGPSARPMSFGQRMFMGMGQHDQYLAEKEQREQLRKAREAQLAFQQMQMSQMIQQQAERKAAQERAAQDEGIARRLFGQPMQMGVPTSQIGPEMPERTGGMINPQTFLAQGGSVGGINDVMALNQLLAQPKRKLTTVAPGASVIDESDPTKPVFTAPDKADKPPSAVQEYQFAKSQGYQGTFEQWSLSQGKARASNVTVPVHLGQKGFDNTLKLRSDFRSEPIYKAHQDVQSAYSQITAALKQASPAGDLAGATKLMKILDPGSVVRESELGMAMAASGLLDRVQNYASMVMSGQKLTPTQRTDFQRLADALRTESEKQYNNKRKEYEGIATRNGLNVDDVLGPASSAGGGGWSITKVE